MPSYKVLEPGFIDGRLYDPNGKRPVYHADKPFPKKGKEEQVPSWLEPIKAETAAQKKKREAAEKKATKAATEQKAADDSEVAGASFLAEGDASPAVETL